MYGCAETPILWPPDVKRRLIRKDPDAGKDWRQDEMGMTEDEMFGWHHWLNGHEFEQAPGVGDGQGELACCSPWGCKELDTTEQLNWTYGLPRWYSGKEFACHCRSCKRCMFNPWIRKIPWRKKWKPTPVFLPRKFQGQRNLADYSPWGCKELDMTEHTPST